MGTLAETRDLACVTDLTPEMREVTGVVALIHRLARRLQTPRGRFPWWPNFGLDVTQYLLSKTPAWRIQRDIEDECLKDEQCLGCRVRVDQSRDGREMTLTIGIETEEGDYVFTMSVTQAAATLVSLQKAA
jgi:hypothetical protein